MPSIRAISGTQFVGIILFFLLPFVNVSCSSIVTVSVSITGQQLATGGQVSFHDPMTGAVQTQPVKREPTATYALAAAVVGLGLSLLPGAVFRILCIAAGLGGAGLLFHLKNIIDDQVARATQAMGLLRVDYEFGFWGAVILFAAAAAANGYSLLRAGENEEEKKVDPVQAGIGVLIIVAAAAWVYLSTPQRGFDEQQALKTAGFETPVSLSVQLNDMFDAQGNFVGDNNPALAAILMKSGFVTVLPSPEAAPWWHFNVAGGTLQNEQFTLPIATRTVTGHSDQQSWTEGPNEFYAETITYTVDVSDRLKLLNKKSFGPYTFRLVMVRNPEVGQWQIYNGFGRGTHFDADDSTQVTQELTNEGAAYLDDLRSAILFTQRRVADDVAQNLSNGGQLASSGPDILVSRNRSAMYYIGAEVSNQLTLNQIDQFCGSTNAGGFSDWHLITPDQLDAVLVTQASSQALALTDAPDHRLWSSLLGKIHNDHVTVPVDAFRSGDGSFTLADLKQGHCTDTCSMQTYTISSTGQVQNGTFTVTRDFLFNPIGPRPVTLNMDGPQDMGDTIIICVRATTA